MSSTRRKTIVSFKTIDDGVETFSLDMALDGANDGVGTDFLFKGHCVSSDEDDQFNKTVEFTENMSPNDPSVVRWALTISDFAEVASRLANSLGDDPATPSN
jgi:hypothetical protein